MTKKLALLCCIFSLALTAQAKTCQIWGQEEADHFPVTLWGIKFCCSASGTMCESKSSEVSELLFEKLDRAQDLYRPTKKRVSKLGIATTFEKELLCPDKRTRVILDVSSTIIQYRPYSTFEISGIKNGKQELWMKRLCSFDAAQLFDARAPLPDNAHVTTQQNNPNSIKQQEPSVPAQAKNISNAPTVLPRPDSNALQLLGTYFYRQSLPANLSTVRHFRTADKQQELKINFSSKDKSGFLQKLQKQFPQNSSKTTYCTNNNILFETQQEVYQAFVLSPEAIIVLARPVNSPLSQIQQKELCNFNAMLTW